MFSGLVEAKTTIREVLREPGGIRLIIDRPEAFRDVELGDSIAVSGCCLTVVEVTNFLAFQAGAETLSRTNLGQARSGGQVNCERSLQFGQRVGGHLVTGHIDALGTLTIREDQHEWCRMVFEVPSGLTRQMASKGSITVDGVSLTLVDVGSTTFSVALIPHTLRHTTLGESQVGALVNLETDILAKYVEQQLAASPFAQREKPDSTGKQGGNR